VEETFGMEILLFHHEKINKIPRRETRDVLQPEMSMFPVLIFCKIFFGI